MMIANLVCSAATASIIQKTEGKKPRKHNVVSEEEVSGSGSWRARAGRRAIYLGRLQRG